MGTANPATNLHIASSSAASMLLESTTADASLAIRAGGNGTGAITVDYRATNGYGTLDFSRSGVNKWRIGVNGDLNTSPAFSIYDFTAGAERLRIDSIGSVLVGKTGSGVDATGVELGNNGYIGISRASDNPLFINRSGNDGNLASLRQDGEQEGSISVSGTTVSYNGGHLSRWSQLQTGDRDLSIKKGTVLSNLDEMCVWNDAEGNPLPNEQLNRVKISDVEGDSNVAGVFVNWDDDDQDNPFDLNMAMTGDMIIRIAQGVSINRGDLLMSAGDGTAKPQGDDIRKAQTIAKVTSTNVTCTYEDGSYCVPCVLMAC